MTDPVLTDQDGTVLIGVERHKRGATIKKPLVFLAACNESDRVKRAHDELSRAFITGKTITQLRREDRVRLYTTIIGQLIVGSWALFTAGALLFWAVRGHP